ncbi:hypothetical protein [Polluticaenibacter yanchengensis]|uniref:Uncharacterized protein n=1 Tax=Polluticaenibacter yanchengensis TaxID=3014562 RepID=A0ABT4UIT1_9BACT|nr:hypothetical protein [Chitinophagaceae bacterium LY-5]
MSEVFLLELSSTFNDSLTMNSGIELFIDTRIDREEKVNSVATISYCKNDNKLGLKKGDKIFTGYGIIADGTTNEFGYEYENRVHIDGKEFWKCFDYDILGVFKDNELIPLNGFLICKPTFSFGGWGSAILLNPNSDLHKKNFERLEVVSAPESSSIKKGDVIIVDSRYSQIYNVSGKFDDSSVFIDPEYVLAIKSS